MAEGHTIPRAPLNRRKLLRATGLAAACTLLPVPLRAAPDMLSEAIRQRFGATPIEEGRVTLTLPALAENGNSVEMTVDVESPMTAGNHVATIAVFAEKNPVPQITAFQLGPHNGLARVTTRIRLADSQAITAVAQMSDGSLWSGSARTVVTLAACLDLT